MGWPSPSTVLPLRASFSVGSTVGPRRSPQVPSFWWCSIVISVRGPHPEKVGPRDVCPAGWPVLPQHFLCAAEYLDETPPVDVSLAPSQMLSQKYNAFSFPRPFIKALFLNGILGNVWIIWRAVIEDIFMQCPPYGCKVHFWLIAVKGFFTSVGVLLSTEHKILLQFSFCLTFQGISEYSVKILSFSYSYIYHSEWFLFSLLVAD